jgi:hypothetical protein
VTQLSHLPGNLSADVELAGETFGGLPTHHWCTWGYQHFCRRCRLFGAGLDCATVYPERIKARAGVSVIVHPTLEGRPKPEYVTVMITNVGLMPVMIPLSFFRWKLPFQRRYWMMNPWDYTQHDAWVPQRTYPAEIRPRGSATFFLSEIDRFRSTMAEMLHEVGHSKWRVRFIKAIVVTDDGKIFEVNLDQTIRKEVAKSRRTAKALDHL